MWLALHGKLLPNEVRTNKNLCNEATCNSYDDSTKYLLYVLRDCGETKDL